MNLELLRVWGEAGGGSGARKTIVFVTHSIPEAVFLADRVVLMSPRPARVASITAIDLPRPRTVETRAAPQFGRYAVDIYDVLTGRASASGAGHALA
jgi:NitT/TauT family transport system ATP-binding protein